MLVETLVGRRKRQRVLWSLIRVDDRNSLVGAIEERSIALKRRHDRPTQTQLLATLLELVQPLGRRLETIIGESHLTRNLPGLVSSDVVPDFESGRMLSVHPFMHTLFDRWETTADLPGCAADRWRRRKVRLRWSTPTMGGNQNLGNRTAIDAVLLRDIFLT